MSFNDKMFENVELDTLEPSPCSPEIPDDPSFQGILINAPRKVTFKRRKRIGFKRVVASIPICGYLQQLVSKIPEEGDEALLIVAINKKTQKEYSGYMVYPEMEEPPPPDEQPLTEEEIEDLSIGIYFNPNLPVYVPLPEEAGVYDIHVELGERETEDFLKSNVVTIEIIEEDE